MDVDHLVHCPPCWQERPVDSRAMHPRTPPKGQPPRIAPVVNRNFLPGSPGDRFSSYSPRDPWTFQESLSSTFGDKVSLIKIKVKSKARSAALIGTVAQEDFCRTRKTKNVSLPRAREPTNSLCGRYARTFISTSVIIKKMWYP